MLSSILISNQKFVLIVDNVGLERISSKTINQLLQEQGQSGSIKSLNLSGGDDSAESYYTTFLEECMNNETKVNVLLPLLSDIRIFRPKKSDLFRLIHKLKHHRNVKQIFLWASTHLLFEKFTLACLEYMANLILYIENKENISILTKKPGGSVTNKHYTYTTTKNSFQIEAIKPTTKKQEKATVKPELLGTFKIELEEDELVARNALKMPYEKTSEAEIDGGGKIIYIPEADDDFDEEDPDDDLYI